MARVQRERKDPDRGPRNTFAKAATEKADEIGHPVGPETREEAEQGTDGHFHSASETEDDGNPYSDHLLYEGQCEGGPMDGMPGQSRFPKGFVGIDSGNSRAWVYDYDRSANVFISRKRDVHDRIRGLHAAEGSNYDVRAFDREIMRGDVG